MMYLLQKQVLDVHRERKLKMPFLLFVMVLQILKILMIYLLQKEVLDLQHRNETKDVFSTICNGPADLEGFNDLFTSKANFGSTHGYKIKDGFPISFNGPVKFEDFIQVETSFNDVSTSEASTQRKKTKGKKPFKKYSGYSFSKEEIADSKIRVEEELENVNLQFFFDAFYAQLSPEDKILYRRITQREIF